MVGLLVRDNQGIILVVASLTRHPFSTFSSSPVNIIIPSTDLIEQFCEKHSSSPQNPEACCIVLMEGSSGPLDSTVFKLDFCLQLTNAILLEEIEKGTNVVASPLSLHVMLSLIAAGSTGYTMKQLLSVLDSESMDGLNMSVSQVMSRVQLIQGGESSVVNPHVQFINGVWVEKSFGLKASFEQVAKDLYRAKTEEVDFVTKASEVEDEVNSWAETATSGLIKGLLPQGSLDEETRLVLANALYFKGAWDRKFDATKTQLKNFHLFSGETVQVPFMTSNWLEKHPYRHFDTYKLLQLPYQSDNETLKFSMYFFLPHEKNGLSNLIHTINSSPGFLYQNFKLSRVEVTDFWIPRFKFSFKFEASESMKALGLTLPFSNGELLELSNSPESDKLYVSDIFHQACIEVNEEGTEAAASTAARFRKCCATYPIPRFVADHPFIFMIREETDKMVFFVGAVLNPSLTT